MYPAAETTVHRARFCYSNFSPYYAVETGSSCLSHHSLQSVRTFSSQGFDVEVVFF